MGIQGRRVNRKKQEKVQRRERSTFPNGRVCEKMRREKSGGGSPGGKAGRLFLRRLTWEEMWPGRPRSLSLTDAAALGRSAHSNGNRGVFEFLSSQSAGDRHVTRKPRLHRISSRCHLQKFLRDNHLSGCHLSEWRILPIYLTRKNRVQLGQDASFGTAQFLPSRPDWASPGQRSPTGKSGLESR